ncbi:MAG: cyclic nucleotide-binding domain-containing protein [Candidatus Omnitrophica bacterium]|nr:cyclic nucleotide-binding domain-containing protein [Candidatus Omnitrophota bacterium]
MKLLQKICAVLTALCMLAQQSSWAEQKNVCLAPRTIFPTVTTAENKYQLIVDRFSRNNPIYRDIPADKFEAFLRDAETLFNDYIGYSAFPYSREVALHFVENEKNLINSVKRRQLELLGRMPRKEALSRRDGTAKLEAILKAKLAKNDYMVADLMGRPGVGKSTIAGKIKNGFASLRPDEILVVTVDGFKGNNITLVNQLIQNRAMLSTPLKDLTTEKFALFEKISMALQFPLVRTSDKSFLDFYIVAEARVEDSAENVRVLRRRILWNQVGSNLIARNSVRRAIRSLSDEEYKEILRIAGEMQLDPEKISRDSGKSFFDIYAETDRDEFLRAVEHKKRVAGSIRLFVVEGTYSYQGQDIFNPKAEKLIGGDTDHLIRVMVEVEDSIVRQRVRDRNRSDADEMLALWPVFDAIFMGSVDLEREFSDLVIDNTESTDIFQIRTTPSGVKAQFGVVSEAARVENAPGLYGTEKPPDMYFLPAELFKSGRNFADLEFFIRYGGGNPLVVVGTQEQKERVMEAMRIALLGGEASNRKNISGNVKKFLDTAQGYFAMRDAGGNILAPEAFIDFHVVDVGQKADVNVVKDKGTIILHVEHPKADVFSIREDGYEADLVEIDYRVLPPSNYGISVDVQRAIQNAPMNVMAVTPMGAEDGFTPGGDYTNFILWLEGTGIHVDPSPRSLFHLEQAGIDFDDIPYVLLTHNHSDHSSGLMRRMLMKKRVKLLTTRPVLEDFVAKSKAILGKDFPVEDWIDWIELFDDRTNEIELSGGRKAYIDVRYNLHPIPTIGFVLSYRGKRFGYSGDTLYDEEVTKALLRDGKISKTEADKLLYFFWDEQGNPKVDLLFHEAGSKPVHTAIDNICQFPEKMFDRLFLVHISTGRVKIAKETRSGVTPEKTRRLEMLNKLNAFDTKVLIPADEERQKKILADTLDNVSILSHLDRDTKMRVLERGTIRSFKPGDSIIFEGEEAETFYIVLSGRADVISGGEKVIDIRGAKLLLGGRQVWTFYPKDSFGEVALVEGSARTATVRAASNVTLLEIRKKDFLDLIYAPLREEAPSSVRDVKYCLEEWIQRYSDTLIESISDVSLSQIAKRVKIRNFEKGKRMLGEGDFGDTAYIIMKGSVGVYNKGSKIASLTTGEIVGEMALLNLIQRGVRTPRNADCVAESTVKAIEIDKDTLAAILHMYPGLDRGLRYEYRLRQLALGAHYTSPHSYSDVRPLKIPQAVATSLPREWPETKPLFSATELSALTDEKKIEAFLNDIFSYSGFFSPEAFSDEFYEPLAYRENLIKFIDHLGTVFGSFQVQRFYHKFVEVSVYDENSKEKKLYRFVRVKSENAYKWIKTGKEEVTRAIPSRPVNMMLVNLESEQYEGVKGTPENVKTLQAYLEAYNANCNVSLVDCQWPENSVNFIIERILTFYA